MSNAEAMRFLKDANSKHGLRQTMEGASNPEAFIQIVKQLGYNFETKELEEVAHQQSEGITTRRSTGVWHWLRTVNWIDRTQS
ncbi:Nif11-like leader peptide family natural product precursor [Roseofilum casamattae]|uniref:Nif11-like leader peptide family natural product n=1 Tax=Roseofilum casamattae BLCC-M143 TaxID=3022442 RepID=A0ABT7BX45_9CYAN|nr:Nif11-like leader peptide family natural product precursor [Roseofilum casamattae]MDJ1183397.1 Nif11-like leader peptide family natural product precursor [Roseofilum casamattae BLCC-M143]